MKQVLAFWSKIAGVVVMVLGFTIHDETTFLGGVGLFYLGFFLDL